MNSGWVYNCIYIDGPRRGFGFLEVDKIPETHEEYIHPMISKGIRAGEYTANANRVIPGRWVTYYFVGIDPESGNPLFSVDQTPLDEK